MGLTFITGMTGAGKTTVGGALAQLRSEPFFDLDAEVQSHAGLAIPEIFERAGEAEFRSLESEMLAELCIKHDGVVALGAGALVREQNLMHVLKSGDLVYLRASLDLLLSRAKVFTDRPLLHVSQGGNELRARLEVMFAQRRHGYECARLTVDVDNRSVAEIAAEIRDRLERISRLPRGGK